MSIIHTLDEHLTNMIAAGEVVERPMGVVKELVENALDAQASRIEVYVVDGGCTSIEVRDDGCGMDQSDATRAFGRHATSKIGTTDDLWAIHTMGFRGEALPSIAAVSKVTLDTCDDHDSTHVEIAFGKIVAAQPGPCPKGTIIKVEELFYRTPARLKHLRSGNVELNYILELMQKMALAHPQVAFSLSSDGHVRLQTTGSGSLAEVVFSIYGTEAAANAIPVSFSDYDFKVGGVLVLPAVTRSTKQYINLFINQRLIRSFMLQKAVLEGYAGYAMPDRYPIVVLDITADPQLVDVNVHPSKWEVRLSKEHALYDLLKNSIRQTLAQNMRPSAITDLSAPALVHPAPVYQQQAELLSDPSISREIPQTCEPAADYRPAAAPQTANALPPLSFLCQLHGRYILACDDDKLYIVDQHAAMERCMYEQIRGQLADRQVEVQPLLVPLVVEMTPVQMGQLEKINDVFSTLGMTLEPFSSSSAVIRQLPTWMDGVDEGHFVSDLLDAVLSDKDMQVLAIRKDKIASLACHSSVKFNRHLSDEECIGLLRRLGNCQQPFNCPHGRPTLMSISEQQLRKEFQRE